MQFSFFHVWIECPAVSAPHPCCSAEAVLVALDLHAREQALKEAFEAFCNKGVGSSTNAELLATFYDNLLKKGGSEKLSDEDVEETLEKVPCTPSALLPAAQRL